MVSEHVSYWVLPTHPCRVLVAPPIIRRSMTSKCASADVSGVIPLAAVVLSATGPCSISAAAVHLSGMTVTRLALSCATSYERSLFERSPSDTVLLFGTLCSVMFVADFTCIEVGIKHYSCELDDALYCLSSRSDSGMHTHTCAHTIHTCAQRERNVDVLHNRCFGEMLRSRA